jgi:plasmid stabilization system protein ParE
VKGVRPLDESLRSHASREGRHFRHLGDIAENSETAADGVEQAIYDACAFLAEGPLRGHTRPDLTPRPLRFWTLSRYPNYTVVYRPEIYSIHQAVRKHNSQ